jgi:hypothetical protein
MKSVSWNVKVHDSEGSSPYIHAETRVESLKLPNSKERSLGQATTLPSAMRYIFEARSHSPKLLPDNIKGDAQRILRISPKAGLFHTKCRTAYSDVQERRKNTFPETEKAFLSSPPGCQNLPKDKGEKGRVLESPRYPRDVMPSLCLGTVSMVHILHLSGLQWIDSSDRGRSSKDERWQ